MSVWDMKCEFYLPQRVRVICVYIACVLLGGRVAGVDGGLGRLASLSAGYNNNLTELIT